MKRPHFGKTEHSWMDHRFKWTNVNTTGTWNCLQRQMTLAFDRAYLELKAHSDSCPECFISPDILMKCKNGKKLFRQMLSVLPWIMEQSWYKDVHKNCGAINVEMD